MVGEKITPTKALREKSEASRILAILFSILSVLINGPFFGYWLGKHEADVYKISGMKTKARVTRSFYNDGNRMYYEFMVDGIRYKSFNVHNEKGHIAGDTIEIIYNKNNPEMNEAIELLDN